MRFGTEIEYSRRGPVFWGDCDPACAVGFPIETVTGIPTSTLPVTLRSIISRLCRRLIRTGQACSIWPFAGAAVGVGDPEPGAATIQHRQGQSESTYAVLSDRTPGKSCRSSRSIMG